ncbi:MAG: hypothetical protein HOV87_05330 [Catenulispora sp.]|nr:hypothetical protein [Catenulispora sp.]
MSGHSRELATALRDMAESEPAHALDVERIVHEGRSGLLRRRMAAFGGGTAVLAATGLAVGVLVPAGSAGHAGTATITEAAAQSGALDPHDPVMAHWQFGYLPDGMAVEGGGGRADDPSSGTVFAYGADDFRMTVQPLPKEPDLLQSTDKSIPTTKIPAQVPGAVKALWMGYADGRLLQHTAAVGDVGLLAWQRPDGQWLEIAVFHAEKRADWKEQALKAAAGVVKQNRSVPMPLQLAEAPRGFTFQGGSVVGAGDHTFASLTYAKVDKKAADAKDVVTAQTVMIVAFKPGAVKIEDGVPPQNQNTCKDADQLRVCVSASDLASPALTAAGGAEKLLDAVTSLGPDPANWTTDVVR